MSLSSLPVNTAQRHPAVTGHRFSDQWRPVGRQEIQGQQDTAGGDRREAKRRNSQIALGIYRWNIFTSVF